MTELKRIIYTACPICEGPEIHEHGTGDCSSHALYTPEIPAKMVWMKCGDCSHIFTNGYWDDAATAHIFQKTHDNQKFGANLEANRPVSARIIERAMRHLLLYGDGEPNKWLDIGFGNASLLLTVPEYGFTPVGIDLRQDSVDRLISVGIEGYCSDISSLDISPVAVISAMDVIEHEPYPREALRAIRDKLIPGGVLVLSMPNIGAPLWSYLDGKGENPYWGELEHYHNFSMKQMVILLDAKGFHVKHVGISERYRCCMEIVARWGG